ncbi:MAG: efflux RND transporter periplasmic adaptor subunit [Crocinitomicaceae bacterium]|nr:efflux RND transporter periplasmic adaptor subunit [Crocinitomicaceae bacterium]
MMKNLKIIVPILTGVVGILLGYVIFSMVGSAKDDQQEVQAASDQIWTCSMHPQIRQNEPGDCPICGMELIPLESNTSSNPLVLEMSPEAVKLAQIQTTIIGTNSDISTNVKLSGKMEANETTSASLVSHIPGRIEKLYVSFTGEKVYRGQKIATIYSPLLITAQKELLEAYKMKDQQPKLFEASKNKLLYWKITDEQIEDIITSGEVNENFHIYAEHSGVVQKRRVSVGDHLNQGGVLFDIQNLNSLWAVFDVYEKDLPKVDMKDRITFTTPSVPGEKFEGRVSFIDPVIDPQTRTAKVRVEVRNRGNLLKPEMFISGELIGTYDSEMKITVPETAVLWTGQRSVVYVQVPEVNIPSYEFREVLLGEKLGDEYQVIEGLEVGEEVVTNGAFVIDASAQLNNRASMMNRMVPGAVDEEVLPDYSEAVPKEFKNQLGLLNQSYIELKDAFVTASKESIHSSATQILEHLENVDMSLLDGERHQYWMDQRKTIKVMTEHILNEQDIKEQRMYFVDLSDAIIKSTKVFGVKDRVFFIQFCPMANNKEGAYWLSEEKEIRNPYFGDKMLTCGEVKTRIDENYKVEKPKTSSSKPAISGHNH